MSRVRLDFGAQVGVPEPDSAVLSTREDVFCGALRVAGDVYGAFVVGECFVQSTGCLCRAARRCHDMKDKRTRCEGEGSKSTCSRSLSDKLGEDA